MFRLSRFFVLGSLLGLTPAFGEDLPESARLEIPLRSRCRQILQEPLSPDDFWPAMHAAEALIQEAKGDEVVESLRARLATETDAQHRCGLARELVRAGDLSQVRTLLAILASPDPYAHGHACESLYKVGQIGDGVLLRQTLATTENRRLAIMAAAALARWGSPHAYEVLRREVRGDDPSTAMVAAWVLGRVGDASDVPALRDGSRRFKEPLARAYFDHARAALGDPEGVEALVANLEQTDPALRVYAAEFAPDAKAYSAKNALIRRLDDSVADVRIRSAQALILLDPVNMFFGTGKVPAREFTPRREVSFNEAFPATKDNPRKSEGSMIILGDGRLLFANTEFIGDGSDFARARVVALTSIERGDGWSDYRVLQENIGKTNVMSATLRRLRPDACFDGPIGLFYLVKNSPEDLQVWLRVSNDEGQTFGEPTRVTDRDGYHVLNNDRVTVLQRGRIIVPVASTGDVFKENQFTAWCYLSDDEGKTWRRSRTGVSYAKRGAMEPEVVELSGGTLLMHIRTQLGHIAVSQSFDGGESWSEARSWGVRSPEAPATLRRIPSTGDLLLIWNDTYRNGEGHGGKRTPLTAAISADDGKTWRLRRDIETDEMHTYAYTSVVFDRGRALLSYYVRDEAKGEISTRFRSIPIGWFYEESKEP